MLKSNKNGKLTTATINTSIIAMVIIVVLFKLYAVLVPEAQTAGNELSDASFCGDAGGYYNTTTLVCQTSAVNVTPVSYTGIPLSGLFSGSGLVFIIMMVGLLIIVVKNIISSGSK